MKECPSDTFANNQREVCQNCPRTCAKCTNFTSCTQCYAGSYLYDNECVNKCPDGTTSHDGICSQCPNGCLKCNEKACFECHETFNIYKGFCFASCIKPGTSFYDGQCITCPKNCDTCSHPNICTTCFSGNFLQNDQCYPDDSICDEEFGCHQCDMQSLKACIKCYPGYRLLSSGQCESCSKDCLDCETSNKCNLCKEGYFNQNGQCEQCSENCFQCSDSTSCTECFVGYALRNDGHCKKCEDPNCGICDGYTGEICYQCKFMHFLSDKKCELCGMGCDKCISSNICTYCNPDFTLVDGVCNKNNCKMDKTDKIRIMRKSIIRQRVLKNHE